MLTSTVIAVAYMFTTFVTASDFEDLSHTVLKREIRDLKKEIREEQSPEVKEYLEDDLQELIDKLCRMSPEDRECK